MKHTIFIYDVISQEIHDQTVMEGTFRQALAICRKRLDGWMEAGDHLSYERNETAADVRIIDRFGRVADDMAGHIRSK